MADYEIETRTMPEQATAVCRASLPVSQVAEWLPKAYQDVAGYLERAGVGMVGPPFARYTFHAGTADMMDIEAGFPVIEPVPGKGNVESSTLPGGPVAVTTHYGRYEQVDAAHRAVTRWLKGHGHQPRGAHWEVYYTDPQREPDPQRWRTDVVVPFVAAGEGP